MYTFADYLHVVMNQKHIPRLPVLYAVLGLLCVWLFKILYELVIGPTINKSILRHLWKPVPSVESSIVKEIEAAEQYDYKCIPENSIKPVSSLPADGWTEANIMKRLNKLATIDNKRKDEGKYSGITFDSSQNNVSLNQEASSKFLFCNLLFFEFHASSLQMDNEISTMMIRMLNGQDKAAGLTTLGNCESILLSCHGHLNYYKEKGYTNPEMVLSTTAHPAFFKACETMDIKPVIVPVDPKTGVAKASDFKKRVTKNTILIACSAPDSVYGAIDPVAELASFAHKRHVGLHLDAGYGGYFIPFLDELGVKLNEKVLDFRLKGITAISVEPHSHGCSALGIGILMYANQEIQKAQYFATSLWCGYLYATGTFLGSKGSNAIAGCWATMMKHGQKGYLENAKTIIEATENLVSKLRSIKGINVVGEPKLGVVSFNFEGEDISAFDIGQLMENYGWFLDPLINPEGIRIILHHDNIPRMKDFLSNLKTAIESIKKKTHLVRKGRWEMVAIQSSTSKTNPAKANEILREYHHTAYRI